MIVTFPGSWPVNPARLPEGKGFDVTCIEGQTVFSGMTAIALVRRPEGSPEIFAIMVVDALRTLEATSSQPMSRETGMPWLDWVREAGA